MVRSRSAEGLRRSFLWSAERQTSATGSIWCRWWFSSPLIHVRSSSSWHSYRVHLSTPRIQYRQQKQQNSWHQSCEYFTVLTVTFHEILPQSFFSTTKFNSALHTYCWNLMIHLARVTDSKSLPNTPLFLPTPRLLFQTVPLLTSKLMLRRNAQINDWKLARRPLPLLLPVLLPRLEHISKPSRTKLKGKRRKSPAATPTMKKWTDLFLLSPILNASPILLLFFFIFFCNH